MPNDYELPYMKEKEEGNNENWGNGYFSISNNAKRENEKGIFTDDPDLGLFKDVNDSIAAKKLLENQGNNDYFFKSELKGAFDNEAYAEDFRNNETVNRQKYIVKVPSRVNVANENEFGVIFKLAKGSSFISENTIVKLISSSFYFSESIFQVTEEEKEIKLTKRTPFIDYSLKLKIYYNNEVVEDKIIDLYTRK